jgi:hypothetical protein
MTAPQTTTTETGSTSRNGSPTPSAFTDVTGARVTIVATALALGAIAVGSMLAWRPWGERDAFAYADVEPIRSNVWIGTLIDGFGFAVAAIALSLVTCHLVRARGSRWATTGAVITSLAGISFAMGSLARGAVSWYATSDAISEQAGTALLSYMDDNPLRVMAPVMAGFLGYTIGSLVLSVALLRAGTVPRWLPITFVVLTLAQFLPVPARALDFIQMALMAVLVCVAGMVLGRRRAS